MADGYRITTKKQNLISGAFSADATIDVPDFGSAMFGLNLSAANGAAIEIFSTNTLIPWDRVFTVERRDDL